MIRSSGVRPGYLGRWMTGALFAALSNLRVSVIAVTLILGSLYLLPPWHLLDDFTGPIIFALLLFLAGADRSLRQLRLHLSGALRVAVVLAVFSALFSFMMSGGAIIDGTANDYAEALQDLHGSRALSVNLVINCHDLASFLFQNPIMMMLTYVAVRVQAYPSLSLDYLLTVNSVIANVIRNLPSVLLLMILGELPSRSAMILSEAMADGLSPKMLLAMSIALSALIWFLFLVTKQELDETIG